VEEDAMIAALVLAAAATATYSPAGKWTLDYQQDLCQLTRPFVAESAKITLGFRQSPADFQTEIVVLFADTPDEQLRRGLVTMKVAGSDRSTLTFGVSLRIPNGRQRMLRFVTTREQMAALAAATAVTIEEFDQPPITFTLDRPGKAIDALGACEIDQIKSWGVDPTQMAVPAKPIGDVVKWFTFPLEAAMNRHGGDTTVRWMIDTQGKVNNCIVVRSSGNPTLDAAACKQIAKRGHYEPAIGKDGKPMPWVETRQLIWLLG
jgi:TonB family protein